MSNTTGVREPSLYCKGQGQILTLFQEILNFWQQTILFHEPYLLGESIPFLAERFHKLLHKSVVCQKTQY